MAWADDWTAPALRLPPPGDGYTLSRAEPWRGGFGVVYRATLHRGSVGPVAVKFLDPEHERVCAAEVLHRLRHRHIVALEEYLPLARNPGWPNAFSMTLCDASMDRLARILRETGDSLPVHLLRAYALHLADALDYLHHLGFTHRDLKPSNVLIRLDAGREYIAAAEDLAGSEAVLSDFGVMVPHGDDRPIGRVFDTGHGSDRWKAPEVLGGGDVPRAPSQDMWSYGQVLRWLFPFAREVPADLARIADACSAPADRRPSAGEVVERIRAPHRAVFTGADVDVLPAYLNWLIVQHGSLELRGVRALGEVPRVELEQVFVALRGDRTTARERQQSRELHETELREILAGRPPDEAEHLRQQLLARHPLMPSLAERDRTPPDRVVNLGDAFVAERLLVVLGDPGSGKTTLARWLTLALARAMLAGEPRVTVPRRQIDPDATDGTFDLGPARLPILLRIADFATNLMPLIDYLGRHPWQGERPSAGGAALDPGALNALMRESLAAGRAVVILDGLDEITNAASRDEVVRAVETFVRDWVTDGNQLVVTSRIAGYYAAGLRGEFTHCTVERMRPAAVRQFCDVWMTAVYRQAGLTGDPLEESARLQRELLDPDRPRLTELASNPLLVTTLAVVFRQRGALPEHRTALYQLALEILVEGWRRTGLTAIDFAHVLAPIAARIHEEFPTGLVPVATLRAELRRSLSNQYPQLRPRDLERRVGDFLADVGDGLGLLVERGHEIYGFVHLTFQEYLAALDLILGRENRPDEAAAAIVGRLGSPRWTEPILLALGRVGWDWDGVERDRLLERLLAFDDPLADLLPRTAMLAASALEEMPAPSARIVETIVWRLLAASASESLAEYPRVRERIESALVRMRNRVPAEVETALARALTDAPGDELAAAAARFVLRFRWHSDVITNALARARHRDGGRLGFPIQACLRERLTMPNPPRLSRMSEILAADAALLRRVRESPAWTRLLVAVFGGYAECHAADAIDGPLAVPVFDPAAIDRESSLTPRLAQALRLGRDPSIDLRALLQMPASSTGARAEALVGLAAWGHDIAPELAAADAVLIAAVRARLSALNLALTDAVVRALFAKVGDSKRPRFAELLDRAAVLPGPDWRRLLHTVARLSLMHADRPIVYDAWPTTLDAESVLAAKAEFWAARLMGAPNDDVVYAFAIALDRIAAERGEVTPRVMAAIHACVNIGWTTGPVRWPLESLPPRDRATNDIPIEAIEAVEEVGTAALRPDFREVLRSVFLDSVSRSATLPPGVVPELLALNLLNVHSGDAVRDRLTIGAAERPRSATDVLRAARRLTDPYRRARALLRLARQMGSDRAGLARDALDAAHEIGDPHARCRVLEHLLPCLTGDDYRRVLRESIEAARQVTDADDRARAFARLSSRTNPDEREAVLRESLTAAMAIVDASERIDTLNRLVPFMRSHPPLLARARRLAAGVPVGLDDEPALALGAIVAELLRYTEPAGGAESLWATLACSPEPTTAAIENLDGGRGLTLTRQAAEALGQLADGGFEELAARLLPLVHSPTPDAVPVVDGWIEHWFESLANHGALLRSEQARELTPEWIGGVLALATGHDDRSRARAFLLLHGGVTVIRRASRHFRASKLGPRVFAELARAFLRAERTSPGLATAIRWLFTDVLMDSPELIRQWVGEIARGGGEGDEAEFCLRMTADFSRESWAELQQVYRVGPARVRRAVARAACRAYLRENQRTADPVSLEWLRVHADDLAEWAAIAKDPCPITAALQAVLPDGDVADADAALTRSARSGAELADVPDVAVWLGEFGQSNVYTADTGGSLFREGFDFDTIALADPVAFPLLVRWLRDALGESVRSAKPFAKQTWLLFVTSMYASREPATFGNLASACDLEPLLARAVCEHDWEPGRIAAIRLIGRLKQVRTATAVALQSALLDVKEVREVAARTLAELPRIDGGLLESLFDRLAGESVSMAHSSARILAAIGRNERTPPADRARIFSALAGAVRSASANRRMVEITGAGTGEADHHRLTSAGRLKEVFFQSLLDVAGVW